MSDHLQERYGTARPRRRVVLVSATTALAIVFLGWLAWVVWFHSDPAINAELTAYRVVDTHHAEFKMDARFRDDRVQGSCLVRATARDHTIVGEVNLSVADLRQSLGDWIRISTFDRATTVEMVRCTER